MKKLSTIILIICILGLIAADTPPALPSSFYGTVTGAKVGIPVTVFIGRNLAGSSRTFLWQSQIIYSLDIPMGSVGNPVKEGTIATFKVGGMVAGSAALHSGTITNLNLTVRIWRIPGR